MSIEKLAAQFATTGPCRQHASRPGTRLAVHEPEKDRLSLQIEDDAGGDPYNRTGQHCLADLKNRQGQ